MTEPLVFSNSRTARPNVKAALEKGPRNDKGDPYFVSLEQLGQHFNEGDVLYLVNKALYQLDYQKSFHKKRNEEFRLLRQAQAAAPKEAPIVEQPQPQQPRKALVTKNSLSQALAKLREETDEDLGPTGEFTQELVPPQDSLDENDAARLEAAFARPPKPVQ